MSDLTGTRTTLGLRSTWHCNYQLFISLLLAEIGFISLSPVVFSRTLILPSYLISRSLYIHLPTSIIEMAIKITKSLLHSSTIQPHIDDLHFRNSRRRLPGLGVQKQRREEYVPYSKYRHYNTLTNHSAAYEAAKNNLFVAVSKSLGRFKNQHQPRRCCRSGRKRIPLSPHRSTSIISSSSTACSRSFISSSSSPPSPHRPSKST